MEHLGRVIDRVVTEKPIDAYGFVEVLSRLVKESAAPKDAPVATQEEITSRADYSNKVMVLNKVPTDGEPGAEDGAAIPVCAIPDFMEEAELISWAGVGFGDVESYKITCSLRNMAAKVGNDAGFSKVRIWGKIQGSEKDYYVAEAQLEGGGDVPEDEPDMEAPGSGVNSYAYYVTNDLSEDWTKLPDLKPREIVAVRQIKKLVTGNLNAKVTTVPYFPGGEAVLLRAQIARISADTTLCLNGFLVQEDPEDENSAIKEADDPPFVPLPMADLAKSESWTHCAPHVLKNGRTTHAEVPEEEEDNPEQIRMVKRMKAEQEADPKRKVLRGLQSDGLQWNIKQVGDDGVYKNALPGPEGTVLKPKSYGVTVVRSLTWPGAVCVARGAQFTNLYVGYGLPSGTPDFFLRAPLDVQNEPEDREEADEPCGEAAVEPTPDEDA